MKNSLLAVIREAECIGCTKCIQACPVDAIVGARQQMHTVIARECTGCELCVAPCPVDCIDMLPVPVPTVVERRSRALVARKRVKAQQRRVQLQEKSLGEEENATVVARRLEISAILERAKRRGGKNKESSMQSTE